MTAKKNGMWDFRSYDEKTWFRFLVIKVILCGIFYLGLHLLLSSHNYNYEYDKLNQDQMQFINRIYIDSINNSKPNNKPDSPKLVNQEKKSQTLSIQPTVATPSTPNKPTVGSTNILTPKAPLNTATKTRTSDSKPCPCIQKILCDRVMEYLKNTFDDKLDSAQAVEIKCFLCKSSPQEATAFLNGTRFKVRSYFWLIGPCVYLEVIFWAVFGVLSSLLFNLGVVSSNATTDLGNPRSQFDNSEIFGQVAKILYAPICTLAVVLGYNFFKDQNIVDISSSKGVIVFAFIGGFYSSRLISLMDRLKDVLMPNSGTTSLPITNIATTPTGATIDKLMVQLALDKGVDAGIVTAIGSQGLNNAIVKMTATNSSTNYSGSRQASDPTGIFTFSSVQPGNYIINADLQIALPDSSTAHLAAQLSGNVLTGTAPIVLVLK